MTISCSSSPFPSISACTSSQVISWLDPTLFDQHPAAVEDQRHLVFHDGLGTVRVQVGIAESDQRVEQRRPGFVVLGRDSHEAADHPRNDRLGHLAYEVTPLATVEPIEYVDCDRPDLFLVFADSFRGETPLEEVLEAVVLGRVHADEHRRDQLNRNHCVRDNCDAAGR